MYGSRSIESKIQRHISNSAVERKLVKKKYTLLRGDPVPLAYLLGHAAYG